jgi:hypothetical protein
MTTNYNRKTGNFSGKVMASVTECEPGRTVHLYKSTSKRSTSRKKTTGRKLVGTDTSEDNGSWEIHVKHARGTYFAIATRKIVTTGSGDRVTCMKTTGRKTSTARKNSTSRRASGGRASTARKTMAAARQS